jgi:glutamate N-acetyltransferase/amino-acid N-acetyltransferase
MKFVDGGVTAPKGFKAAGFACGLKKNGKKDIALVSSDDLAVCSGIFTTNKVKGHSLLVTSEHVKTGYAKAILVNSGNANACVGEQGYNDAKEMASLAAELLDCDPENILLGSTGVIGQTLNMPLVRSGIRTCVSTLSVDGSIEASEAILTTDLVTKETAVELELQGEMVRIGGMAKGSGMIHPNMATMIGIITTDINISRGLLDKAFKQAAKRTFNRISIDGETSVCDMVVILANGEANNQGIVKDSIEYIYFVEALEKVCSTLSKMIVKDGEGATKFIEIVVDGAANEDDAYNAVSSIAKSPLVKTAMFGEDANWGRIVTAAGYSGADFDPNLVDVHIGNTLVCRNGTAVKFDEKQVKELLKQKEISIKVNLKKGPFSDKIWTCDFSSEYIKINGNYRS